MLVSEILILFTLLLIFIQDLRSRAVYWFLFPILVVLLLLTRHIHNDSIALIRQSTVINITFLLIQLFLVTIYFSFKNKRFVNVVGKMLGLGDVLFLLSIAFYLSTLNFLFFYMSSLIIVLIFWLLWQLLSVKKSKEIPLAGMQAIIFILFLASDWWLKIINLTDDNWLLRLITK